MMLQLSIGWSQTVGQRDYQQDAVTKMIWPSGFALALLSDGMGGAVHGEVASQEILRGFSDAFCASEEQHMDMRLQDCLMAANQHLAEYIAQYPQCQGMGGTLVATAFTGEHLHWLSVGDSPLWLVRDARLIRLNQDHSKKAELLQMVAAGLMDEADIAVHPQRNQLTSAVMGVAIDFIDVDAISLLHDDIIILASDGVETMPETELASLCHRLRAADLQLLAEHIIGYVQSLQKPYQDNATVMVLKFTQMTSEQ
ncbi:PP2C family protein-serine/threonine phosphatase [Arsukibacterium sp.]|uniref:PP2C family protein-serine/threonine phosphatase n=1 Tax=Arsukibacterium sp. TaxID=1977258 RepID=UPI002FDB132E